MPSLVSATPRGRRSNSITPSSCSSALTRMLSDGWAMCNCSEAARIEPQSAMTTK
jgi:hypothetical protein